jgi:hypothetical protein
MPKFNKDLYKSSLKSLVDEGVPIEIAVRASEVVAKDQAGLPHLGRTAEDQEAVREAMRHYWAGQSDAQEEQE